MAVNLMQNLVSYWKMDEASGNRADSHGSHTLTDNNTVGSATGKLNNGADFEADNSESLSVADHADFDFSTAMSWSLWIKPESLSSNSIFSKFLDASQAAYRLRVSSGGLLTFLTADNLTDQDDSGCPQGGSGAVLSAGIMTHLVAVYDGLQSGNANRMKIYANNVSQSLGFTGTIPATLLNSSQSLALGIDVVGGGPGTPQPFDGILDEVACWNKALNAQEVTALYNGGRGLFYPLLASSIAIII